jgi:hypothetical protein
MAELRFYSQFTLTANSFAGNSGRPKHRTDRLCQWCRSLRLDCKKRFSLVRLYSVIAMKGQVVYPFTAPYPGQIQLGRELEKRHGL